VHSFYIIVEGQAMLHNRNEGTWVFCLLASDKNILKIISKLYILKLWPTFASDGNLSQEFYKTSPKNQSFKILETGFENMLK